jgi:hypothetical protein
LRSHYRPQVLNPARRGLVLKKRYNFGGQYSDRCSTCSTIISMVAFITSPIDTLLQGATRARAPGRTCTAVPTLPCKPNSRCDLRETKLAPNTRWGSRSRDPIGYFDGSNLFEARLYVSYVDPTGNYLYLESPTVDSLTKWIAHCAKMPTLIEQIKCLRIMAGNPVIDKKIAELSKQLLPKGPVPKPDLPPIPIPVPPLPPLGPSPFPPPGPRPVPAPVPNPLPDPSLTPCAECLASFPPPANIMFCLPLCCIEELKKYKGECERCSCKKPSGAWEFYDYKFSKKYSCENFPNTEEGKREGVVSCSCGKK